MDLFLHQFLSGLSAGGIYASIALALVMIYQATHHVNFAQGEMAMFSTFLAWLLIQAGLPYWGAVFVTVLASFGLGALIQAVVIRPLAQAPVLSIVVVFIGLMVIFNSVAGLLFGYTIRPFPSPFPQDAWFGSRFMSPHEVGVIGVTLLVMLILYAFFRFTTLGLAMRAAAQQPDSSRLVGIHVGGMLMLGWGLAGATGAVGGMMVAPSVFLDPNMMTGVLIYAFAGALIGGIDNPAGAVLGGFIVGVLENLIGSYVIGTELKLSVALILIIAVLIVRPAGLLGKTIVSKV